MWPFILWKMPDSSAQFLPVCCMFEQFTFRFFRISLCTYTDIMYTFRKSNANGKQCKWFSHAPVLYGSTYTHTPRIRLDCNCDHAISNLSQCKHWTSEKRHHSVRDILFSATMANTHTHTNGTSSKPNLYKKFIQTIKYTSKNATYERLRLRERPKV